MTEKPAHELLPCPFCGCATITIYEDAADNVGSIVENGGFYISHPLWKEYHEIWNCRCEIPGYFESKEAAAKAWNTRADIHAAAIRNARNEALREVAKIVTQAGHPALSVEILAMIDQGRLT